MKYCFLATYFIRMIILFIQLCTFYEGVRFASLNDNHGNNTFIEPSKLYRKKETAYYFYVKTDHLCPINSSRVRKVNVRSRTNIRESDKFFINQEKSQKTDQNGDLVLQAEFKVSKPKPWRKDDQLSASRNAKAEEPVDPDNSDSTPEPVKQEGSNENQANPKRKGFQTKKLFIFGSEKEESGVVKISMSGCGRSRYMNERVVNGKDATLGAYPWIVAILKEGDAWCGGSIVNEWWILTAAHCFMGSQTSQLYAVRVGTINRNIGTTYKVEKVIIHERFHLDNMFNSDIALVKVSRKIKMGKLVNGVCLPSKAYEDPQTKSLIVVGWGQTSFENKELPVILQEVALDRVTIDECAKKYKIKGSTIYRSQVCTWNKNQDACQGDSGSPAIEWRNKRAFQIGIVSYGSTCADDLPGVYTKVSYFTTWIASTMESH